MLPPETANRNPSQTLTSVLGRVDDSSNGLCLGFFEAIGPPERDTSAYTPSVKVRGQSRFQFPALPLFISCGTLSKSPLSLSHHFFPRITELVMPPSGGSLEAWGHRGANRATSSGKVCWWCLVVGWTSPPQRRKQAPGIGIFEILTHPMHKYLLRVSYVHGYPGVLLEQGTANL